MTAARWDVAIVGGGIIGLATALALTGGELLHVDWEAVRRQADAARESGFKLPKI